MARAQKNHLFAWEYTHIWFKRTYVVAKWEWYLSAQYVNKKIFSLVYYLSLAILCNANYDRMVNQMLFYVIFALIVLQRIKSYYQGLSIDWIRKQPHNRVTVIIYFTTETIIGLNNRVGTFHNACSNTTSFV